MNITNRGSMLSAKSNNKLICEPTEQRYLKHSPSIVYPPLLYIEVDDLDLPVASNEFHHPSIRLGGSYTIYHTYPFHAVRQLLFEELYFPYKLDSPRFKVRNNVLLWPRLNLSAFTYLVEPNRVFIRYGDEFCAEFIFYRDHIVLREEKQKPTLITDYHLYDL